MKLQRAKWIAIASNPDHPERMTALMALMALRNAAIEARRGRLA